MLEYGADANMLDGLYKLANLIACLNRIDYHAGVCTENVALQLKNTL